MVLMTLCRRSPPGWGVFWLNTAVGWSFAPLGHSIHLAAACTADAAAGIRRWMGTSSPRWHFLPVQLATGNKSDNTNSHWSVISVLLWADYGGGLWPQAALCRGPMSGLTQGKAIRIYYAKRPSCIRCLGSVKLWYCSLWTLGANPRCEKIKRVSTGIKDVGINKDRNANDTENSDYLTRLITIIEHTETL